jgi:HEAT repeat protein
VLSPNEQWAAQIEAPDPYVRQKAIHALGQQEEAGYPHLLRGLHSKDLSVRLASLQAMSGAVIQAHQDELWRPVMDMLNDRSPQVRRAIIGRLDLFSRRTAQVREVLRDIAAHDPDAGADAVGRARWPVRNFAANMLITMDCTTEVLRGLLRDNNPLLRKRAAEALGAVSGNGLSVRSELEAMAGNDEEDPQVRQAAAEAVATIRKAGRSSSE